MPFSLLPLFQMLISSPCYFRYAIRHAIRHVDTPYAGFAYCHWPLLPLLRAVIFVLVRHADASDAPLRRH